ncbi:unnamed protein product [Cochlearia groenlandica]
MVKINSSSHGVISDFGESKWGRVANPNRRFTTGARLGLSVQVKQEKEIKEYTVATTMIDSCQENSGDPSNLKLYSPKTCFLDVSCMYDKLRALTNVLNSSDDSAQLGDELRRTLADKAASLSNQFQSQETLL